LNLPKLRSQDAIVIGSQIYPEKYFDVHTHPSREADLEENLDQFSPALAEMVLNDIQSFQVQFQV
jgi:hypothetical protein